MNAIRTTIALVLGACALAACDQIFGIREGHPEAGTGGSSAQSASSSGTGGASTGGAGGRGGNCAVDPCCTLDCLGGACKAGQCQPIELASGRTTPTDLGVTGGVVYWIEQGTLAGGGQDGAVYSVATACVPDGGAGCIKPIAQNRPAVAAIIAGSEDVYWTEESDGSGTPSSGVIWRWSILGASKSKFATLQNKPRALFLDESGSPTLYWANEGVLDTDGEIRKEFTEGGTPGGAVIVANQAAPLSVLVDNNDLYWSNYGTSDATGTIGRADIFGAGAHAILTAQGIPRRLAVTSTHLYWVDYADGTLSQCSRAGTSSKALATDLNHPAAVIVAGHWVVWTEAGSSPNYTDGRVAAKSLDTGAVVELAKGRTFPYAVTADSKAIYWVDRGSFGKDAANGSVEMIARPQ